MNRWMPWVVLFGILLVATSAQVSAEDEGSLRFEKTVTYEVRDEIELDARVGPVKIHWVQFLKPTESSGGFMSRLRAGDGDVTGYFRAMFDCENPHAAEWNLIFTVELLDKDGELIDRASRKAELEGEAKKVTLEHPTLKYILPMIQKVNIRIEAKAG